jgi:CBS domain containing-hemolysin-like protein
MWTSKNHLHSCSLTPYHAAFVLTIGGLFHDTLERIPELDDVCEWRGFRLQVIETPDRGNFRVLVTNGKHE